MKTALDHIVFAAASLDAGTDWFEKQLGVRFSGGGEHPQMGTHNRLLRLGENSYLEIIAINPGAEKPPRPRWFSLDEPSVQDSLETSPRLLTWVARTDDINTAARLLSPSPQQVHAISRGSLNWLMTIPDDGALLLAGVMPTLIQWQSESHPTRNLTDAGVSLIALELATPNPEELQTRFEAINFDYSSGPVRVVEDKAGPRLTALLDSPNGSLRFDSLRLA